MRRAPSGLRVDVANASSESEDAPAFSNFVGQRADAILILPEPFFLGDVTRSRHSRPATPFRRSYDCRELAGQAG